MFLGQKTRCVFLSLSILSFPNLQSSNYYIDEEMEYVLPKKTYDGYRKYEASLSSTEKKDIRFILKTLAQKSLASLLGYKSQLEAAGDRIEHIHPLRFLEFVFSDEEMKAYCHQIRKRGGMVWNEFIKGIKNTLHEEFGIGNCPELFINDFAANVGIDPALLYNAIINCQWEEFVKTLLFYIPRDGDHDRYDM